MEQKYKLGRIAALVAAVLYALSAIHILIGTFVENRDVDGSTDDGSSDVMFLIWAIFVLVATIAAAIVVWQLLKKAGVLSDGLAKAALAFGLLAIFGSFFCWLWQVWGVLLAVAFLLTALTLRKVNLGVIGTPSNTDWTIPVVWPVAAIINILLWTTDLVEEDTGGGLDWAYSGSYALAALVTAAVLVQISRWLNTPIQAVTGVVRPVDPPESTEMPDIV